MATFLLVPVIDHQQSILIVSSTVPGGRGRHRPYLTPVTIVIKVRCLSPTVTASAHIDNMSRLVHNRITIILTSKLLLITPTSQLTPILSALLPLTLFGPMMGFMLLYNLANVLILLRLMSGGDCGAFFGLGG